MKTSTRFKLSLLAALAATAGAAQADTAETKGGIKVRTDDGRFEMNIGGRIHIDANIVEEDKGAAFGSGLPVDSALSSAYFRRARLNITGRAYGWEYNFAPEFSQSNGGDEPTAVAAPGGAGSTNGSTADATPTIFFQELYVAKDLNLFKNRFPNISDKLFIGQFKPFRSMEELTSSNEITMMERPITSASGVYNGRQFQTGFGYQVSGTNWNVAVNGYNMRSDATRATEGVGFGGRAVYAPIIDTRTVLHLGVSAGRENPANNINVATAYRYYGRRGPNVANSQVLGTTTGTQSAVNIGAEIAGVFGPFYYQTEYARADYSQAPGVNPQDSKVDAFSGTISYNVFGEVKPYDIKKGVFKNIKPSRDFGALELTARIDYGRNRNTVAPTATNRIREYIGGFNYYFNPNVRAMFNYVHGEADRVNGQKDRPHTYAARLQFNF